MTSPLPERIGVTVIGGFLGAGKTTLVNHLIRTSFRRLGVIVNEFGTAGVDGQLIQTLTDDVQELTAGCLCCTGREDLLRALVHLAHRAHQDGAPPDHVLIELSGVADPVPVLHTLLDPMVRGVFRLRSLVAVADARFLTRTLADHPEAALQLAYATTVVLNKTDLVPPAALEAAADTVGALNPLARVLHAEHGHVDAPALLDTAGFDADWTPPPVQTRHTPGLKTVTLEADRPLSARGWHDLIGRIAGRPGQVLRVKGHVSLAGQSTRLLLHAVRDVLTVDRTEEKQNGRSRVVMIGRDLDAQEERAAFAQAMDAPRSLILPRRAAPAGGRGVRR